MSEIRNLEPKALWEYFDLICSIPHPSKKEERIIQAMVDFAKENDLEHVVDEVGNVIIRKPATKGYEDRKGIILQAHLDMVPQKNSDVDHDFEKDPIQPYIDGDWVKAKGTTLGADNGIGVAAALAVLADKTMEHGPVEALLTIDEETGMTGAFGLKPGYLHGDILMNLDSETEGELYVGCAGGIDANISFDFKREDVPSNMDSYALSITGLKGGHSGMDIILGRGNANKIMFRIFKALESVGLRVSDIEGGSLRNAIPREGFATVLIPSDNIEKAKEILENLSNEIKDELKNVEPDLKIELEKTDAPSYVIDEKTQYNLIRAIYACPNGVMRMSDSMEGLTETSTNLAIVKTDGDEIKVNCLLRSSVDSAKMDLAEMMASVFELAGAKSEFTGAYPGWKPNMDSPILKTMQETYNNMYGKVPAIMAIHAGLECGLLGGVYPNWDMISFGPTIMYPHSPDEKVNVPSVKLFWDYLVETLRNAPKK